MRPKLSIQIPIIPEHSIAAQELIDYLFSQDGSDQVEIITCIDNKELTIAEKRNKLLQVAQGDYVVQIDADDWVSPTYIPDILQAAQSNPDCITYLEHCSFTYPNFSYEAIAHISNRWDGWHDNYGGYDYVRTPFYKCPIKREIVHKVGFDISLRFGEDHHQADKIKELNLIKTEVFIPKIMEYYRYIHKDHKEKYNLGYKHSYITYFPQHQIIQHHKNSMKTLLITHSAGMCSCSTVALQTLVSYFNENGNLPQVDRSHQYIWYGNNLTSILFQEHPFTQASKGDITSDTQTELQFINYSTLLHNNIKPYLDAFFQPSSQVLSHISFLEDKYSLDYDNLCAIVYRSNDKNRETTIASPQVFIDKAKEIKLNNPYIKFFLMPDTTEMKTQFLFEFPDTICFEETKHIPLCDSAIMLELPFNERPSHAIQFFSELLISSKCNHSIIHTGNIGLWHSIYKGSSTNLHQYKINKWL